MPTPRGRREVAISALRLYFDGGSRPNPGAIEIAVVVRGVEHIVTDLGPGDNSDAEWMAAIHALHVARDLGAARVDLRGDSMLVISQARGTVPCRSDSLRAHLKQFQTPVSRRSGCATSAGRKTLPGSHWRDVIRGEGQDRRNIDHVIDVDP